MLRGRLLDPEAAPATGERSETVGRIGSVNIEQILSGRLDGPAEFLQDHDEWVLVLHGAAILEVDGVPLRLETGDWVLLPAGNPHRLVTTEPGTCWLALHADPRT